MGSPPVARKDSGFRRPRAIAPLAPRRLLTAPPAPIIPPVRPPRRWPRTFWGAHSAVSAVGRLSIGRLCPSTQQAQR